MSFWSHKVFLLLVFWSCFSSFVVGWFVCVFVLLVGFFCLFAVFLCLFGFFFVFSFLFVLLTCLGLNICPQFQVCLHLSMVWPPVTPLNCLEVGYNLWHWIQHRVTQPCWGSYCSLHPGSLHSAESQALPLTSWLLWHSKWNKGSLGWHSFTRTFEFGWFGFFSLLLIYWISASPKYIWLWLSTLNGIWATCLF